MSPLYSGLILMTVGAFFAGGGISFRKQGIWRADCAVDYCFSPLWVRGICNFRIRVTGIRIWVL